MSNANEISPERLDPSFLISFVRENSYFDADLLQQIIDEWKTYKMSGSTIRVPCKIGDFVWAIRCYKGVLHPQQGCISEMFFTEDMRLQIVVKHIARGEWGKVVFPSYEEAFAAIEEKEKKHA